MTGAPKHLGWTADDLATLPYARFWKPVMAPLSDRAVRALERGQLAPPLLPPLEAARAAMVGEADGPDDGYVLTADGGMRIAIRSEMPGVTPDMVDWWFGWHGDRAAKYKLWHPDAHVNVAWREPPPAGSRGRDCYVGRTSIVDEYLGSRLIRGAIRFVPPAELGFGDPRLDDPTRPTIVCARVGMADGPVNIGWLAHSVIGNGEGSTMRSRFWMGGGNIAGRGGPGGAMAAAIARRVQRFSESDARAILTHCAEEMGHLARFLPALHAAFHDDEA